MSSLNRFALASGLLLGATNSRAASPSVQTAPRRASRAANSSSIAGDRQVDPQRGQSKLDRPGNSSSPTQGSRWAHFAGMTLPQASAPAAPVPRGAPVLRGATKVAAMRIEAAALGRNQAKPPSGPQFATAGQAAAFALRVYARATAPHTAVAITPDTSTHKGLAAHALAVARRAGIIK